MNWYLKVMKQYADFSGRARRKEYWMFVLFNFIFATITSMLDNALKLGLFSNFSFPNGLINSIYSLVVFIPGLAVTVRRLHDTNRSGWNILWSFLPIIGWIMVFIYLFSDSDKNTNQYGVNPKTDTSENEALIDQF